MGQCYGKTIPTDDNNGGDLPPPTPGRPPVSVKNTPARSSAATSPWPSPYPHALPPGAGVSPSPARSTPRTFFKRPFPPPSPAKHIKASLAKRFGKPREGPIPEHGTALPTPTDPPGVDQHPSTLLDKNFGYSTNFGAKYELGKEVGRGHFGHTCQATGRKGDLKDHPLAVKIISKSKFFSFSPIFLYLLVLDPRVITKPALLYM